MFERYLYGGSLWFKSGKTPLLHLVYDVIEKSLHHVCPSFVVAVDVDRVVPENFKADFENKITDLFIKIEKSKKVPRLPQLSKRLHNVVVQNAGDNSSGGSTDSSLSEPSGQTDPELSGAMPRIL